MHPASGITVCILFKDTDCLHSFNGQVKGDRSHPPALPVLVFKDVCTDYNTCHAKHLLQLFPAHLIIELRKVGHIWEYEEKKQ